MQSSRPKLLNEVLQTCNATCQGSTTLIEEPIRVMLPVHGGREFNVIPYVPKSAYIAVSYTWPNPSWTRLYNSNNATFITNQSSRVISHHVSEFARTALQSLSPELSNMAVWVDHECIKQGDLTEKATQVAVMDRIYSTALLTIVLLEDIELKTDELELLQRVRRLNDHERRSLASIVKRIISARWFSRAWCSQEMILSRATMVFVHRTGEPLKPIDFSFAALSGWVTAARLTDSTILPVTGPRGLNGPSGSTTMKLDNIAWAYGAIIKMGCYNLYDKIALVYNLTRTPILSRLVSLPDTQGQDCPIADANVHKILNVAAILRGDFSLLLVNHVQQNPLQHQVGFRWGGSPVQFDTVSASWIPKNYDVDLDPGIIFSSNGLCLKGYAAKVLQQVDWRIWRDPTTNVLHVSLDGAVTTITSEWLTHPMFNTEPEKAILRDILYTVEHQDARDLYPNFVPQRDDFVERDAFPPDASLKGDILARNSRPTFAHNSLCESLAFFRGQDGSISFNVIRTNQGLPMVVKGNVDDMMGKWLFQPHVARPKVFASNLLTVNSMILDAVVEAKGLQDCACIGGVRGFQLLPASFDECNVLVV